MNWLKNLPQTWRADLFAGFSVAVVAIPQSLAYAKLAGLPVYIGLYAGILPTIVAGMAGSSPYIATGATAIIALLTFSSISIIAVPESSEFIMYASLLALLVGLLQIIFAFIRAGTLIKFIAHPVIIGFINAAAIIIALSQIEMLIGLSLQHTPSIFSSVSAIVTNLGNIEPITAMIGIGSVLILLVTPRIFPRVPGVLVVTVLATLVSWLFKYNGDVVGTIPRGLPALPVFSFDTAIIGVLIIPAIIIAIIGYMEGYLIAHEIDGEKKEIKPNQELGALGAANVASGISGAFPVAGSVSRTVLQYTTGAKTGLSSIVVGLLTLLVLLFFSPIFTYLPLTTLSAIIIVAIFKLINPREIYKELNGGIANKIIIGITLVTTLFFAPNLEYGLIIGIISSLIFRGISKIYEPHP